MSRITEQNIYHKLNLTIPSRKKREIIRSKYKNVKKVDRPHEIWEVAKNKRELFAISVKGIRAVFSFWK
jgi:hypothetical protein